MKRIRAFVMDRHKYVSAGYVTLRIPLGILYAGLIGVVFARPLLSLWTLIVIIPAGLAAWGAVVTEREMVKRWFGADLTPMAPDRPPERPWRQKVSDVISNPVTYKSLAFIAIEGTVGFLAGMFVAVGLAAGIFGTFGFAIAFLASILVALVEGTDANFPAGLPLLFLALSLLSCALLVGMLYASVWVARLQIWFVKVMLGMSRTQAALAAARAEAAAERERADFSDRSRRDLVLNVSHELRNPLATIRAHVDTLRGDGADEPSVEDRRRYLGVLNREVDRLAALVEELLTLASADAGRLQLEMGPVNAGEVATQVHDAMAPLAWRERHIQLLCETDGAPEVMADRGRLAQVLMNLVRNAITHTPEGGLVAIAVKPLDTGPVEMSVSDTGAGIEPDEADRIFDRFYRTDASRTRATGGFGLGLAIAREMVDAMGGRISVDSTPGQGSRFTVTLVRA